MCDHNPARSRPWWRKKRTWFIALLGIMSAASIWMRSYNEAEAGGEVRTRIGDYKSTEPMGLFPISLLIAVRKFPTYDDCVELADDGKIRPKWAEMSSEAQVKVCVFRIADHLGDFASTQSYFGEMGLRTHRFDDSATSLRLTLNCSLTRFPCKLPELKLLVLVFYGPVRYGVTIMYHNLNITAVSIDYEIL
ncbi:hypothetical protein [Hoeflea sp.]|uniref:hypothetical protein n=1 Tax=Hoeflea sp. TaxID=1940281 RepID=UPI003A90E6E3